MPADLRLGDYRTALADVREVDAIICDPPYSARTHAGHDDGADNMVSITGQKTRSNLGYRGFTEQDVRDLVSFSHRVCGGWLCFFTDHILAPIFESEMDSLGRYVFAPLPIIQKRPRLLGDGPASWCVWLVVSRPRTREFSTWGCLPGMYEGPTVKGAGIIGAKPLDMMRAIVRDYSKPGDLVCDPCAGSGTTLLAAMMEGREAVGAELDPKTYALAKARLDRPMQAPLMIEQNQEATQLSLIESVATSSLAPSWIQAHTETCHEEK